MSKSVASKSKEGHDTRETGVKRGAGDEEKEEEESIIDLPPAANSMTLTTFSTVPATTDQFMHTPEFRRHFVEFVHVQTLMALRCATKAWKAVAEKVIDEGVRSGELTVHGGKDISDTKV
ncbi:hypothetical protein TrLO_g14592 [Triparma laevis f. longispina]|uniref:Uncharacterized protein n=1 Tax=Triparma laevis f. longispina TaxID=1714387 RepID=A0A9W7A6F8_9STRA|nr:hypothetical protein TrLO_g14592 [Triparma laevis f. longispina]